MNYGEKIAQLRKENNLTQKDLGDKLNISPQAVSKWEKGLSQPDIESLRKISELFDVSIDDLVSDEEIVRNENEPEEPIQPARPAEPEFPIIGVCSKCKKKITADMEYRVVNQKKDGMNIQKTYCMDCYEERKKQKAKEKEEKIELEKKVQADNSMRILYKGLIWGGVAAVIMTILLIIGQSEFYYVIAGALATFSLVAQIIWGNWLADFFLFFCRSFKAPFGFIFELSLDGIIWLLTVKLALWILCGILSVLFFLFGLAASFLLALVCAPFNIPIAIVNAKKGELEGLF